ncbi:LytR/AlgR family response regulator transcription factor [Chitinophaga ginsengisoli]|uniref:LytTr DNA-binding domain-containing protein n=1 Tax=Chitinophaga ginsengisoli TaxID=363837 RepID=A0A2P8GLV2_9BACT|nr:LytTR family DNA-binding domain-containing protein [Chitinophaga ginsengisoli]PSL34949.1 LytTr DNA-binding domain-containing protein [Chitinophaga ginsengisoli]
MKYQERTTSEEFNEDDYRPVQAEEMNNAPKRVPCTGKRSFLVLSHNKYLTVPTERIAFFYVKFEGTLMVTVCGKEYSVNYSLEQIQQLLSDRQFFRLNRQYLINFDAIKEVERYFARKLLVIPTLLFPGKMIVSRQRGKDFLDWLENR